MMENIRVDMNRLVCLTAPVLAWRERTAILAAPPLILAMATIVDVELMSERRWKMSGDELKMDWMGASPIDVVESRMKEVEKFLTTGAQLAAVAR